MAIDPNAMYRAGFSSRDAGRDIGAEKRKAFWGGVAKTAYNVIGTAAIGQVKQNYNSLQKFRNASDSQTSLLNLRVDKMPKGNESLTGSIQELKKLYDVAARKASFGIGKARSKGKQDMTRYMTQLSDMNAVLEIYKTHREKAQGMASVMSGKVGENNKGGQKNMSAGNDQYRVEYSLQQANGELGARLRWDIESGQMKVQVGGEWREDELGKSVYMDKAATGTYEEYVAEDQEMNLKLKGKQLASQPGEPDVVMGSRKQVDLAGNPSKTPYGKSEKGKYAKDALSLTPNPPMSREEWTKQNQDNRGLIDTVLYSDLKFAVEEDGTMGDDVLGINEELFKEAYKADSVDWSLISENRKKIWQGKVDSYSDDQFKDYYFGGDSFDHSANRMTESAPAYQRLKKEDELNELVDADGKWKKGYGPKSKDWEGRLLMLKGQSFVRGSFYRKEATDRVWDGFKNRYNTAQAAYQKAHPKKIEPGNEDINKFGLDITKNYYSMVDAGGQTSYIDGRSMANTIETFKKVQEKGSGIFTGYDDVPHMLKKGKWFKYNKKTSKARGTAIFDIPSNANSIFTSLKWNNYPRIMEYLKENPDKNKDGIPDVLMDKDNYAKKYTTYKPRTYRKYSSSDAKKGIGIPDKYYEAKDGTKYQYTREDGEQKGKYIKIK